MDQQLKSKPVLVTSKMLPELRPEMMAAMAQFGKVMKANRQLPERLVELMRLRIAFHNQCRPCMSMRYASAVEDGLTEGLVCSLERPQEAPDMTPAERAAVAFGDKFSSNGAVRARSAHQQRSGHRTGPTADNHELEFITLRHFRPPD